MIVYRGIRVIKWNDAILCATPPPPHRNIKWRRDGVLLLGLTLLTGDTTFSKTRLQLILIISNWWANPSTETVRKEVVEGNKEGRWELMLRFSHSSSVRSLLSVFFLSYSFFFPTSFHIFYYFSFLTYRVVLFTGKMTFFCVTVLYIWRGVAHVDNTNTRGCHRHSLLSDLLSEGVNVNSENLFRFIPHMRIPWQMSTFQAHRVIKFRFIRLISILIKTLTPPYAIKGPRRLFSPHVERGG